MSDFDHPLDLSFTKDIHADKRVSGGAGYASDNQLSSESAMDDSISLSEESIARKIDQLHESNENPFAARYQKDPRTVRRESKLHQSKELK